MAKNSSSFLQDLSSSTPVLLTLLLIGAFLLGATTTKLLSTQNKETANTPSAQQPNAVQQLPTGAKVDVGVGNLPVLGNKNAKITIVEFADFQCPFCERFFKDVEPSLIKDYVDTGKAKFAFRHYAFLGDESTWAGEASECANEQGKFWEFHDFLYNHQGPERSGTFAKDKLEGFAKELGLTTIQFNSCLESDKYAKRIADDLTAGQKAGVNGTPTVFINGQMVVGAQPYSAFKTIIDQALTGK